MNAMSMPRTILRNEPKFPFWAVSGGARVHDSGVCAISAGRYS